jgi:anti-anti-sigma factor
MRPPLDAGRHRTSWLTDTSVEVVLTGDIDMVATFKIESEVDRLLARRGVRRLILNLAEVRFIDSAGVGALLSIREWAEQLGVEMTLANLPDPVQRVLNLNWTAAVLADWPEARSRVPRRPAW